MLESPTTDAPLVVLRDAGPADRVVLLDLHRRCFPTDAEARLVADLLDASDAPFSIAAETDGRLVGHVLLSTMTHEHGGSVRGLLALAPLAVAPDFRGRGIGRALVREALRQAAEHRAAAVFVLGDPTYYAPLGFTPAGPAGYQSPHGDAFQVHPVPNRPAPSPGRVDYAPAFARLADGHSTG
ncbi:MAG: N-acetyltransferase [Planctomycetota bacterium]